MWERGGEKTALKIKAWNSVSQEKEAEIVYTIARRKRWVQKLPC